MNTYLKAFALAFCVSLTLSLLGCQKPSNQEPTANSGLSPEEQEIQKKTKQVAAESLGLKLEGSVDAGHKDNFSGLRTENITFTQRLDSRTYIAYDNRFSDTAKTGVYKEADEALLKRSHELLERLKIPVAEIAAEKVVTEKTQVGERDAKTGKFKMEAIEPGKKWALTSRQVNGIPVFSSRATIALAPNGEIGFLEVHWPEIPAKIRKELARARRKGHSRRIRHGWYSSFTCGRYGAGHSARHPRHLRAARQAHRQKACRLSQPRRQTRHDAPRSPATPSRRAKN